MNLINLGNNTNYIACTWSGQFGIQLVSRPERWPERRHEAQVMWLAEVKVRQQNVRMLETMSGCWTNDCRNI